jgi:hypothetical protein
VRKSGKASACSYLMRRAEKHGRGIMISEPKAFGLLFLNEGDIATYEDLEFVSRSHDSQ